MDDKNINFEPPADLPKPEFRPTPEVPTGQTPAHEQEQVRKVEQGVTAPDPTMLFQTSLPSNAAPILAGPLTNTVPPSSSSTTSLDAEDSDLIEKEWVAIAKQIVGQTRNDPYVQNKEMSKVKADYIKKRYNKDLKINND